MNVLMINGSPRKGNTYALLGRLKGKLEGLGHSAEILNLSEREIKPCRGCYQCILNGEDCCPLSDDVMNIWAAMAGADGVVLSSPLFAMSVTGLMKNFMDRIISYAHRPRLRGKPAALLSTAGGTSARMALDYLRWFSLFGFDIVGERGYMAYPAGKRKPAFERSVEKGLDALARALDRAMRRKKPKAPSLLEVVQFFGVKANGDFGEGIYNADREYARDLRARFGGRVNPLKVLVGRLVYSIGRAALRSRIDLGIAKES